jgi:tetratricopeptide (TPR) repeat protein
MKNIKHICPKSICLNAARPFLIVVVSLIALPGKAQVGSKDEMEKIAAVAIEHYQNGNYRAAIAQFERAYAAFQEPNILFNMARCYDKLGELEKAGEYYNRFISDPYIGEGERETAREYLEALEERKDSGPVAQPEAAGANQAEEPPVEQSESTSPATENETSSSEPADVQTEEKSRVPEWVLFSFGVAGVVAGGVFYGLAYNAHSEFESATNVTDKEDYREQGEQWALAGDIAMGSGAAFLVTSALLLIFRDTEKQESRVSLMPVMAPSAGGVSASVLF